MRSARSAVLLAVLAAGCSRGGPPGLSLLGEIESPAGEGSGEPFLSSRGDTVYLSWLQAAGGGAHELRFATLSAASWSEARVIARSDHFFVNWADFPSVSPGADGALWAHWLERGAEGGYDYGVRVARSGDAGASWSDPWAPHDDRSPTEHGFVATVPVGSSQGFLWLDGRRYAQGADGSPPTEEMALYFRLAGPSGPAGPETLVDQRVCDCCQTDMALTETGPVAVYRDRTLDEIRDIRAVRYVDGAWTEGVIVHEDGWETAACPVNGPAVAANGENVVVAWFTAAGDVPRVRVAFSRDGGASFAEPVEVDDGNPAGRVDVLMTSDGSALVSWLERTGGEAAEVRVRAVHPRGGSGEALSVSASSGERASGFPRLVRAGSDGALVAWTDVADLAPRVRVAWVEIHEKEGT